MHRSNLRSAAAFAVVLALFNLAAAFDPATAPPGCRPVPPLRCSLTGSSWKTVDTFLGGESDTWVRGAAASKKAVIVVGATDPSGGRNEHWIVRRSLDRGETWSTADDFTPHPAQSFSADDAASDPRNGHLYVVGGATAQVEGVPWQPWVVRKSTDDGATWTTVDSFTLPKAFVGPQRIAVDGKGVVYVAGIADEIDETGSTIGRHGVLRRSSNGGATWTTQELLDWEYLRAVGAAENGEVFIGGPRKSVAGVPDLHWQVGHSLTGTGGWSVVDSVDEGSDISGIRVHPDGRVIVYGSGVNGSTTTWLMRQSTLAAPTTWATVDRYQPVDFVEGFGNASAGSATFALDGSIYSSGTRVPVTGAPLELLTRHGTPPATLFIDSDHVVLSPTSEFGLGGSVANATTAEGDILVATTIPAPFGSRQSWIVRKLTCK